MFLDESKSMSHLQVGIHTSGLLSYHSLWVPNTYHGRNSLQIAYNCVQQSSWRLSFFLSFSGCNEPVWLAHDYRGTKKNSETLDIPPNRSLYTQNQILVMNWNVIVVWEPTRIFWTRPPPTRQCWVLIFTSCKTAYIAGGDKVTANNYRFGTRSKGPGRCEAHWKHAIRGSQWHYQCCQEPGWSTGPGAHPQTCQATRWPILVQSTSTSALPHPLHPLPGIKAWEWRIGTSNWVVWVHTLIGVRATPSVLSVWPCKLEMDEKKWKHVSLAQQNGFDPAFLHGLLRPVQDTAKPNTCWRRV